MPTPACSATAAIGAPGSATNTVRAASRMRSSLRAASARRPLMGVGAMLMAASIPLERIVPFYSVGGHGLDHAQPGHRGGGGHPPDPEARNPPTAPPPPPPAATPRSEG